ncbi:radical SAM additional 4Fe4S-binding SPASM domain-containing protein [Caloranaerobacter azorensis DSM 13643]|uniref:Radical SAM additional 4Fe4S-binding SPASM domain-containing protein n=1 Tax=Caloranaerobacter azorensis DSM 13643 TaxID=1121264 RepID=A0A1M5RHB9_9FIRM|nr:radical SAM protein [Caloranaerobacter azorensis]SHH25183.1 radical SAM additional 4Fe4S-binding SPASM domain-containing protein [Caloranaerobacter azorensis DSM 13643]
MFDNITRREAELFAKFKTSYEFGSEPGFRFVLDEYNDMFLDKGIIPETPIQVGLNITSACNLRCKHCSRIDKLNSDVKESSLFMHDWENIIEKLYDGDVLQVFITGGEPFMHPDIKSIIKSIKERNMLIGLLTNGLLIDESIAEFLKTFFTSKFDYIQLSMDSVYENYNNFRNGGDFNRLIKTIDLLVKKDIRTHVTMVVTDSNYKQMFDVYRFCIEHNVRYIKFMSLFEHPSTNLKFPRDDVVLKEFCKILEHYEKYKPNIKILSEPVALIYPFAIWLRKKYPEIKFTTGKHVCPAANSSCEISIDGNVYPCAYLENSKFYAGNILYGELREIWSKGVNWEKLRDRTIERYECINCDEKEKCYGACPAMSYYKYSNFNNGDSRCIILRESKEVV